jgi:hypothetical protein
MSDREPNTREWWPADYVDEVLPSGFAKPEQWIKEAWPGHFVLIAADPAEDGREINPGDIIEFASCDSLGAVEVTVKADGTYFVHGTYDQSANSFWWSEDPEVAAATTMDDLAQQFAEYLKDCDEDEGRYSVNFDRWSDTVPYVFGIDAGKPVLIEGANQA